MRNLYGRLSCLGAFIGTLFSPLAQAAVIDFEPAALTGLYLPGDTFSQGGFVLTTRNDFGTVDSAASLGAIAPTGNASQFYFNSNDGTLSIALSNGGAFSLAGFAAAFVPLDPVSSQVTVIVATATTVANTTVQAFWSFGTSATSNFPFISYSGAGFAAFTNLKSVDFHACSLVGGLVCTVPTLNNGQFAIDNIVVNPVPEPSVVWLLAAGLAGLALRARRAPAVAAR